MTKEQDNNSYSIKQEGGVGEVFIANEVVAIIAGVAASEVEGVAAMSGNIPNEIIGKLGVKNLAKGATIDLGDGVVRVDLSLTMKYGYSIPKICTLVQDKVKSSIESMTGLNVEEVNIHIVGVDVSHSK